MDPHIENHLEDYLRGTLGPRARADFEEALAASGGDTRRMVKEFQAQSHLMRSLKAPEGAEPAGGFYARVMERIEARRTASVWNAFVEPLFFRRLALASMALLLLLGVTIFTAGPDDFTATVAEEMTPENVMAVEPEPLPVMTAADEESRDAVLVQLTTFQE